MSKENKKFQVWKIWRDVTGKSFEEAESKIQNKTKENQHESVNSIREVLKKKIAAVKPLADYNIIIIRL